MQFQFPRLRIAIVFLVLAACEGRRSAPPREVGEPSRSEATRAPGPGGGQRQNAARRVPLLVFAATSLRDVLGEVGEAFHATGRPEVEFNFAGSNVLAQQLVASDRGEVFVSADEPWVDYLVAHDRAVPGTKRWFLSNTLVIVAHPSTEFALPSIFDLGQLPFEHLSIADPASVPAGRYAKAYLESVRVGRSNAWEAVETRVAPAADVRAALAVVAADADSIGVVYRTDARAANVRVLFEVPPGHLPAPVRYHAIVVAGRPRLPLSTAFVEFLGSPEARAIFERHGFIVPQAP